MSKKTTKPVPTVRPVTCSAHDCGPMQTWTAEKPYKKGSCVVKTYSGTNNKARNR